MDISIELQSTLQVTPAGSFERLKLYCGMQKKKRIEAINGGWAVLGLTIGIIVEGYTGKGILSQVSDLNLFTKSLWSPLLMQ